MLNIHIINDCNSKNLNNFGIQIIEIVKTFTIIATTLYGLEEVLANEVRSLGVQEVEVLNRAVRYHGDLHLLYRSNIYLRTALKVLKPIAYFTAHNELELYHEVKKVRWEEYMSLNQTLAVDGTTNGEVFNHSKFVALKTKDAIVDRFRETFGSRPSVDVENPDLQVNIHIADTSCTISLDSSGTHLGKRGYRQAQTLAPISETLAAGIIYLSGWNGMKNLLDPMCGSGTFPIEAALIATNTPPGLYRNFAFEKWKDFDSKTLEKIKKYAESQIIPFEGKIMGRDMDKGAVRIATHNAERAGVEKYIDFENKDFLKAEDVMNDVHIVMNPPYGERLNEEDEMIPFYKEIGSKLKHFYMGCDAWVVSGNLEAIKFVGLKPSRKIKLFNGPIECRLHHFQMYQGTKKIK